MENIPLTSTNTQEALEKAGQVLRQGGLVVYPTETCYGLAADATQPQAIEKLLAYKRRREGKPLSVLVSDPSQADQYVIVNDSARRFYDRFLPGPMTVVSKVRTGAVAPGVASEYGTLGIRISSHPFAMALAKQYKKAITATSANASWQKKPYTVEDILKPLAPKQIELLDLIIDAGKLPKRETSTVVDTTLVDSMIIRPGAIKMDQKAIQFVSENEEQTMQLAQTLAVKYWDEVRKNGIVFNLVGELGVGKTVFAKGIGRFLKIKDTIVSPSYTLANEYHYSKKTTTGYFHHLDPWRLESYAQLSSLGIATMIRSGNIVAIEWANKFIDELNELCKSVQVPCITVYFEETESGNRVITVDG